MPTIFLENLNLDIKPGARLSEYTTFQLGGPCKGLITCQNPEQLEKVVTHFIHEEDEFILIGCGSNLVVSDQGLDCYVIRYVTDTPLVKRQGNDVIVSASTSLDDLVEFALEESLEGINYCSGIPGTVGGAIVGNAGAFGKQIGDVTKSILVISQKGEKKEIPVSDCGFTYRDSKLKKTGYIVLSVTLGLKPGDKSKLHTEREEILRIRHEKHPNLFIEPCAGSFFRNIEPTSKAEKRQATGWFLEQAGGKNLKKGGAVIFEKHANIIIKSSGCKSQDVFDLHLQMAKLVKEKFHMDLVREVRFVGEFKGKPKNIKEIIW